MADHSHGRTLTALYETEADAERTMARLVEAGLPEASIEAERASEAEVDAKKHNRSKLMAALFEFEMPSPDRQSYERGMDRGGIFVVAPDGPAELEQRALDIMDEAALDTETEAEEDFEGPDHPGAIGSSGGYGRAMGDVDRLTGRRMGPADPPDADPAKEDDRNYGSAHGGRDRLTGEPTGGPRRRVRSYRRGRPSVDDG